jgi:hypothetical protein
VVGADETACARAFFRRFGRLSFRRDVTPDDELRYVDLFRRESTSGGDAAGIRSIVEAVLQSPRFLYRIEPLPTGATVDVRTP